jgi:hypothetical protein
MVCLFNDCLYSNTARCINLKLETKIRKHNFACYFVCLCIMVFALMGGTWAEGRRKPGAFSDIWT